MKKALSGVILLVVCLSAFPAWAKESLAGQAAGVAVYSDWVSSKQVNYRLENKNDYPIRITYQWQVKFTDDYIYEDGPVNNIVLKPGESHCCDSALVVYADGLHPKGGVNIKSVNMMHVKIRQE